MKTTVKGILVGLAMVGLLIGMAPQMAWSLPVDDHGSGDHPNPYGPDRGPDRDRPQPAPWDPPTNPKFGDNSCLGIWDGHEWVRTPNMGHWDARTHRFVNGTAVHPGDTFVDGRGDCWAYTGKRWVELPNPVTGNYHCGDNCGGNTNCNTWTDSTGHKWKLDGRKWVPDLVRMVDGWHWCLANGKVGERVSNNEARRFGYDDCHCICLTRNHRTSHNAVASKTATPKLSLAHMGVITTAGKLDGKIWVKAQQNQSGQSNGKQNDQNQITKATYTWTVSNTGFASALGSSHGGPPNSLRMHNFRTRLGR